MKPQRTDYIAAQPARVEFKVQFSTPHKTPRRTPAAEQPAEVATSKKQARGRRWGVVPSGRPSKATLLLALAHHWERLVREGVVKDYAEIARLAGLTRARVTQIMNLMLLAPDIQEQILLATRGTQRKGTSLERKLRALSGAEAWSDQRALLLQAARS